MVQVKCIRFALCNPQHMHCLAGSLCHLKAALGLCSCTAVCTPTTALDWLTCSVLFDDSDPMNLVLLCCWVGAIGGQQVDLQAFNELPQQFLMATHTQLSHQQHMTWQQRASCWMGVHVHWGSCCPVSPGVSSGPPSHQKKNEG